MNSSKKSSSKKIIKRAEKGAAMAIAIIILAILSVVALTALAFSSTEARIAGSDLQRTHAFYAAAAGMEKMTGDFSNLFRRKMHPTDEDLTNIAAAYPQELNAEGFQFTQTIAEDTARLSELRAIQGLPDTVYPHVNISEGSFAGLYASLVPYKMTSTAHQNYSGAEVKLEREFNNYLIPLFQFGMFSNEDIEIHPGPFMTFNGRIHSNRNIYALKNTLFLNRVTAAEEFVRDAWRSGAPNPIVGGGNNVWFRVNGMDVQSTIGNGSVMAGLGTVGGPNIVGSILGLRGFFPDSPSGIANPLWEINSVRPPLLGLPNSFGGQLLTRSTGASALRLPLENGGNSPAELIKRPLPSDDEVLSESRYSTKAQVRILIDDVNAGSGSANVAGIPANKGVFLKNDTSGFAPLPLGGGNALRRVADNGTFLDAQTIRQKKNANGNATDAAQTVRGIKNASEEVNGNLIPAGAGIEGKILIEIVNADGTAFDVTREILSMGMTVGEPNGIVTLQRPIWAAFVQGSRDRQGTNDFNLVSLTRNTQIVADGEISDLSLASFAPNRGYLSMANFEANEDTGGNIVREYAPSGYNSVVPINIYNVREGWYESSLDKYAIHERGITTAVELNMRNLARWFDGVYDGNLLAGTSAVSTNIRKDEGYVVYVSDRRGDRVKTEYTSDGTAYTSTNGTVDNEDIYGANNQLEPGEDVIDFGWNADGTTKKGSLQKDTAELLDSGIFPGITPAPTASVTDRLVRAQAVLQSQTSYFRRSVRLFDGETLSFSATAGKLSPTKGITISSENMVYIWGSFNATGITGVPANGSTLNNGGFTGPQVPSSIVCDAFFPLSKTWFDALPALYPEGVEGGNVYRKADEGNSSITQSTTVRVGIIAGATISAVSGYPARNNRGERISGGIQNYPRFLEDWTDSYWNYTGSLIPLFHSTQAISQYEEMGPNIYSPPRRNWSFDDTFLSPQKLPPGTPFFQYVQATGFRQSFR